MSFFFSNRSEVTAATTQKFVTKGEVVVHRVDWKIENFSQVVKDEVLIKAQKCSFETKGIGSSGPIGFILWLNKQSDGEHISANLALSSWNWEGLYDNDTDLIEDMRIQLSLYFAKNDASGNEVTFNDAQPLGTYKSLLQGNRLLWMNFLKLDSIHKVVDGNDALNLICGVKMLVMKPILDVTPVSFKDFVSKSSALANKHIAVAVMEGDVPFTEVSVIASDGKEFKSKWGALAARSSVFDAMYSSGFQERQTDKIEMQNISGKALEVLLHFIHKGELLPAWKDDDVIVEFTNAAAMYEFKDLLEFLDQSLGTICNDVTSLKLFSLARNLSLKKAEVGILEWIKKNGLESGKEFAKLLETAAEVGNSGGMKKEGFYNYPPGVGLCTIT